MTTPTHPALARPFPGIRFRAEPPPLADPLPRMDVAAFVGFAARGPLHIPVAFEDVAHFHDIFGVKAPRLAWDADAGDWVTACLSAAVHDFFTQGGRRCWVVRIAGGGATYNRFPLAGLLYAGEAGLTPAHAQARAVGSWSDGLQVAARPLARPLRFLANPVAPGAHLAVTVQSIRGAPLSVGDLLQLDFTGTGDGLRAFMLVEAVTAPIATPAALTGGDGRWLTVSGRAYWFRQFQDGAFNGAFEPDTLARPGVTVPAQIHPTGRAVAITGGELAPPAPGAWMIFRPADPSLVGSERLWLMAEEGTPTEVSFSAAWWEIDPASLIGGAATSDTLPVGRVARVTFALRALDEASPEGVLEVTELAYSDLHERFWGHLPVDEALYAPRRGEPEPAQGQPWATVQAEATVPRFPLAGAGLEGGVYLPLGSWAWQGPLPQEASSLARDGLIPYGVDVALAGGADWAAFLQDIYLDPWLEEVGQGSLLAEAFDRQFVQGIPPRGLHSLLGIEEVGLLALPDAAQRGWRLATHVAPAPVPEPPPKPTPPPECPGHDLFRPLEVGSDGPADTESAISVPTGGAQYSERWELLPVADYDASGLLMIQRSATWMAAARADMIAILGMPEHYRPEDALHYRQELGRKLAYPESTASYAALYYPWLISREPEGGRAGSGAAASGPATGQAVNGELATSGLRRAGPEGAACGIIAARGLARGAWVAAANELVRNAVALPAPLTPAERADLYNSGINLVAREPRGFLLMGADTLSTEEELLSLGVRRLLILLRRLALREGQTYVFAPNSPAFRRRVALGFERWLGEMFARGAFAGDDPSSAYRVVVDETVNPPASIEQGRFIVELRVAPSQPLTFITVRLVQTEPETLTVQEV